MLRNFPHQVNRLSKIRGALQVVSDLANAGQAVGDDGTFGFAVARAGIYAFRGLSAPTAAELETAIRQEQTKSLSNQGPRTFARDLRRTLVLLGLIEQTAGGWRVTSVGRQLLALPDPPDPRAASLWTDAVLQLELSDGGVLHPARNMLRMVERRPGIDKKWLAFALDMSDDSDAELGRVLALHPIGFGSAVASRGATSYQAANAVKILPSLVEQLGLLSIDAGVCNLTPLGTASLSGVAGAPPPAVGPRSTPAAARRRRVGYGVLDPGGVHDLMGSPSRPRTTEEQLHSAMLLEERTWQHQDLVKRVIAGMKNVRHVRCSDNAFDILIDSDLRREVLLIEAKTLRGDALVQARVALGQLLYYEYFDVQPTTSDPIIKVVAFDSEPGDQARHFLAAYAVESLVVTEAETIAPACLLDYFG